jgi:putative membrane protein
MTIAHIGQPLAPHDLAGAWSLEPTVLGGLILTGWLYWCGLRALWGSAGSGQVVARSHAWAFATGLVVVLVALVSPLDALSNVLFSAHMTQHLLLTVVAAPLLVLGSPAMVLPRALADRGRRRIARWQGRVRRWGAWRGLPVAGLVVYMLTWAAWHVPALYNAALRSAAVHAVEHTMMLATAFAFWSPVLRPRRTPVWAGPLLLAGAAIQGGILAALLVFSPRVFYAHGAATTVWGLDPLSDQALAGVIMWVPGGIVYLVAAAALFVRWLDRDATEADAVTAREAVTHVS